MNGMLRNRHMSQQHERMADRAGITEPEVQRFRREFLINVIGPRHREIRGSVAEFFGAKHVEESRPLIREIVGSIFDDVADVSDVELISEVTFRIPSQVYLALIGKDHRDRELEQFISHASDSILKIFREDPSLKSEIEETYLSVFDFVRGVFAEHEAGGEHGEDLISTLHSAAAEGRITTQEAFDLAVLTLEASVDNTYTQMIHTLNLLLDHPDQWALVKSDPARWIQPAIEESIRFRPRVIGQRRTALEDFEMYGADVPKGTEFYLSVLAAHRDPAAFADADTFDITRTTDRPSLMFGGGMTACMGSGLARVEMQEFMLAVVERFPDIQRLAASEFSYEGRTVCVPHDCKVSLVG
jgi:cytochrome P450